MVNPSPLNPYLSEQTRLEAQRRMLAERYGLYSDDSEDVDAEDEPDEPAETNQAQVVGRRQPAEAHRASGSAASASGAVGNVEEDDSHHLHRRHHQVASSSAMTTPPPPGHSLNGPSHHSSSNGNGRRSDPASSDSVQMHYHHTLDTHSMAHPQPAHHIPQHQLPQAASAGSTPLSVASPPSPPQHDMFPPIELVDAAHGRKICANFSLPSARGSLSIPSSVGRDVRVTQIAMYSSQLLESHGRKIAVSDHILSYAVGGHIRAILRHSPPRCLLKGHSSVVADIEFLSFMESRLDNETADHISILGSVADDGSVYVWKLVRSGSHSSITSSNLANNSASPPNLTNSSSMLSSADPMSAGSNGSSNLNSTTNSTNNNTCSFNIADAIRFEHPEFDKGKCYKRIAFRPGPNSIIAENGIGVAMLLLDMGATDLRIVELVKMNDKMMVRDKFLRARNEIANVDYPKAEGNLQAAAWLSETVVVTSRGGQVFLWNAENTLSNCFARVPRAATSPVTAIHTLDQDVLLFVTSNGQGVEIWERKETSLDMTSTTLQLNQTLELFDAKVDNDSTGAARNNATNNMNNSTGQQDIHCVTAIDPSCQIVLMSNVRQRSLIVLHYNKTAKAFDTITEVPLQNFIYSCSVAPLPGGSSPVLRVPGSVGPTITANGNSPELGVWCIQPTGIQVVHLPASIGRPSGAISNEIYPKPVPKTGSTKTDKKIPLLSPSQVGAPVADAKNGTDPSMVSTKPHPRHMNNKVLDAAAANAKIGSAISSPVVGSTVVGVASASTSGSKAPGNLSNSRAAGSGVNVPDNKVLKNDNSVKSRNVGSNTSVIGSGNVSGTPSGSSSTRGIASGSSQSIVPPPVREINKSTVNTDEIVETLLNAARKAIASFEESAVQRSANEKVKAEKLMETVAETAESNMEAFINSSMKKVLAETLIPGVSEIIADSRKGMKEKTRIEAEMTRQHFEEVMERSNITASFGNGCKEMGRQVEHAVTTSLTGKFDCLVGPAVDVVNEAVDDLTGCVTVLRDEVDKVRRERSGGEDDDDDDEDDDDFVGDGASDGVLDHGTGRRRRKRRTRRGGTIRNRGGGGSTGDQDLSEPEPEDVRQIIDEQLTRGAVDEAFLTALDKQDVGLVMWLCAKFNVSSFFVEHTLSQVALMSLAAQLGQEIMVGDDVVTKVDWLLEVMIALEPDSEEIESISVQAVRELSSVVNEMRKNVGLLSQHVGLDRKLKTLARLVASQMQN